MKQLLTVILLFSIVIGYGQDQRSNLRAGQAPFFHGVASGDPLMDGVMLWTRVTPPNGDTTDVQVYWQIATDVTFTNVVNFGETVASDSSDYTVKLDVCGLQAGTHYYYVFQAYGHNSVIGRTKTAPNGATSEARFAVASCSSYEHGYFNAYESMSKRNDLDAIIHLGDYIYEYASGGFSSTVVTGQGRTYEPTTEIISLEDYRIRHSHYKLDDQLQRLHQVHPFITTWDDHESANDSYKDGAQNHDPLTEGTWVDRKVNSAQAYKEWMPIRNPDANNDSKIWRSLQYGNLLDLIVLDSRIWARDLQDIGATNSTNRDLLGDDQFLWLEQELSDNTTQWKVICQQVMMAPLELFGAPINADQWDGYNKDRNRLINYIESQNIQNPVILTGDIHTSWVNNVPGNALNTAAVEFVVTSVTSPGLDVIETALGQVPQALLDLFGGAITGVVQSFNPHMQYINVDDHGYMVLSVNATRAQGDYIYMERESIDTTEINGPSYYTNSGVSNMLPAAGPVVDNTNVLLPPEMAVQNIPFAILQDTVTFQVNEGMNVNGCIVDAVSSCPTISTSILQDANYGVAIMNGWCFNYNPLNNFNGEDNFSVLVCRAGVCDTVLVLIDIVPINDVQGFSYTIASDSLLSDCIMFNDLIGNSVSISDNYNGALTFSVDSAGCFNFMSDTMFSGVVQITLVGCDTFNLCDSAVLNIIINGYSSTQIVELNADQGELVSYCLGLDDLYGNIISSDVSFNVANGNALVFNDTCISYLSNSNFAGLDTLIFVACDDYIPPSCDTIMYIINVEDSDTSGNDTVGIIDIINDEFAVIGVYPTPFSNELLMQYYQFKYTPLELALYAIDGRLIYKETIVSSGLGLKYARLETSSLATGTYVFSLSNGNYKYGKKVQKY